MTRRLDLDTFTDENRVVHRVGYASIGSDEKRLETQGYLRCTFVTFLIGSGEEEFHRLRRELTDQPPKTVTCLTCLGGP